MKREILFRGKRIDNEQWVQGFYFSDPEDGSFIFDFECIYENGSFDEPPSNYFKKILSQIVFETVGQFIGLVDKNGTKIFEGDIVSFKRGIGNWSGKTMTTTHIVSWDESVARFSLGQEKESIKFRSHPRYEYEVIGNIFDNPELLTAAN